jgi:hypothetical protein
VVGHAVGYAVGLTSGFHQRFGKLIVRKFPARPGAADRVRTPKLAHEVCRAAFREASSFASRSGRPGEATARIPGVRALTWKSFIWISSSLRLSNCGGADRFPLCGIERTAAAPGAPRVIAGCVRRRTDTQDRAPVQQAKGGAGRKSAVSTDVAAPPSHPRLQPRNIEALEMTSR